ncbi:MAG: hypothetical protein AAGB14_12615, partial [Verrucomicrobiota bacterium]
MGSYFQELAQKLWHVGRLLIPGVALFEFVRWFLVKAGSFVKEWFLSIWNDIKTAIAANLDQLNVDLAPPP